MTTAIETEEFVAQDVELVDLSSLVEDLYTDDQVERPGIICEIAM